MISNRHKVRERNQDQVVAETGTPDEALITDLVKKSADGDFKAYGKLYELYLDRIYRYVFYQVKDKMTAEDVTEEIFLKAWHAIGSYRGKGQSFSAWLYRIAHNHIIDDFRTKREFVSLDLEALLAVADPDAGAEKLLTQEEVSELVSCLPPQQKQIITLKFIEGLDNPEIAEVTGKSQGAIRIMQMRALATLRRRLTRENSENG